MKPHTTVGNRRKSLYRIVEKVFLSPPTNNSGILKRWKYKFILERLVYSDRGGHWRHKYKEY